MPAYVIACFRRGYFLNYIHYAKRPPACPQDRMYDPYFLHLTNAWFLPMVSGFFDFISPNGKSNIMHYPFYQFNRRCIFSLNHHAIQPTSLTWILSVEYWVLQTIKTFNTQHSINNTQILALTRPMLQIINCGNIPEKKIVTQKRTVMRFIPSWHETFKFWVLIELSETPW